MNVLTEKECLNLIKITEDHGYEDVNEVWRRDDVRKSQRCIIDRVDMAELIWNRIKEYIPEIWNNKGVVGLNERLRFLKYSSGQYFKSHKDGSYKRPDGSEQSFITIHLYLNEGMEGGNTTFISRSGDHNNVGVVPKIGRVLVFQHDILHEGSLLVKGTKYTMRTDVMYTTRSVTTRKQDMEEAPVTPSPVPNIIPGLYIPPSSSSKKKKKKKSGAIDKPEPEQLDKVAKKPDVMKEIFEKQSQSQG